MQSITCIVHIHTIERTPSEYWKSGLAKQGQGYHGQGLETEGQKVCMSVYVSVSWKYVLTCAAVLCVCTWACG